MHTHGANYNLPPASRAGDNQAMKSRNNVMCNCQSKVPVYEMWINHLHAQLQKTQDDLHHAKISRDQMDEVNMHLVLNLAWVTHGCLEW